MEDTKSTTAGVGVKMAEDGCSMSVTSVKADLSPRLSVFERAVLDAMERVGAQTVIGVFSAHRAEVKVRFNPGERLKSVPLGGNHYLILQLSQPPQQPDGSPLQGYIASSLEILRGQDNGQDSH